MGLLAAGCLLAGCAGTSFDGFWGDLCGAPPMYGYRSVPVEETPAFPRTCLTGDPLVADTSQCFAGGDHCYQLDTGAWCAGPYSPFVLKPVYHAGFYDWSK